VAGIADIARRADAAAGRKKVGNDEDAMGHGSYWNVWLPYSNIVSGKSRLQAELSVVSWIMRFAPRAARISTYPQWA
jgi:hypothetical protein